MALGSGVMPTILLGLLLFECAARRTTSSPVLPKHGSDDIEEWISEVNSELADPEHQGVDLEPLIVEEVQAVEGTKESPPSIPFEINASVEKWIEYFTTNGRESFQKFLTNGERYRSTIVAILKEHGIPEDLYYQALIESGFNVHAVSRAAAVGVWQFIAETGKRYDLEQNYYVDERRDPIRSTVAAAMYLQDLHNVFQSWYLAMAAYNAGEVRILQAIMKANSRNFWKIAERKVLPRETMNYIPKFLAAAIIGHNPERFGFHVQSNDEFEDIVAVDVPAPVRLGDIAAVLGVSKSLLKQLNPNLRRGVTPPGQKKYKIWVLPEHKHKIADNYALLQKKKIKGLRYIAANSGRVKYHRIRKGENLAIIARKYRTSIWRLKRLNGLRSNKIIAGSRLKVPGSAKSTRKVAKRYRVKPGDSLFTIGKKFGKSIAHLKKLNRLTRSRIYIGQILKI